MNALSSLGTEFLHLVTSAILILLLLRLQLQLCHADFYNPISQGVVRATAWLDPLRKVLGHAGGVDMATLVAMMVVQIGEIALSSSMAGGLIPGFLPLFATASLLLLDLLLSFFFWAILGIVIASWLAPQGHNPVASLLYSITEPLLGPARRLLPAMGGLDFSPMLVMFALHALQRYALPALAHLMQSLLV